MLDIIATMRIPKVKAIIKASNIVIGIPPSGSPAKIKTPPTAYMYIINQAEALEKMEI